MKTLNKALFNSAAFVGAAGLVAGGATPAAAGDWAGFYIGAGGVVKAMTADARSSINIDDLDTFNFSSDDDMNQSIVGNLGEDGKFATIEGGFDWRLGASSLIGIAGDFTFGGLDAASGAHGLFQGALTEAQIFMGLQQSR